MGMEERAWPESREHAETLYYEDSRVPNRIQFTDVAVEGMREAFVADIRDAVVRFPPVQQTTDSPSSASGSTQQGASNVPPHVQGWLDSLKAQAPPEEPAEPGVDHFVGVTGNGDFPRHQNFAGTTDEAFDATWED
ncbi:hypothetical protein HDV00_002167 [Rhizophlyctis rosea]|nr:hypothetical protein HDV00_002167 [Rhizophlyctis rosea]